jgi:hypothetical protein
VGGIVGEGEDVAVAVAVAVDVDVEFECLVPRVLVGCVSRAAGRCGVLLGAGRRIPGVAFLRCSAGADDTMMGSDLVERVARLLGSCALSAAMMLDDFVVATVLGFLTFTASCSGETALRLMLRRVMRTLGALAVLTRSLIATASSSVSDTIDT